MRQATDTLLQVVQQAEGGRVVADTPCGGLRKTAVICITAAFCLGMTDWFIQSGRAVMLPGTAAFKAACDLAGGNARLARMVIWAGAILIFYLLLPVLTVKIVLREKLRDYGWRVTGIRADLPLYGGLLAFMLVLVAFFSGTAAFQAQYPFYPPKSGEPLWPAFWIWELLYMAQFVAVEFFFRGFLVHGLKERLGFSAVLVMIMPYCMIHAGKPVLEMLGSIFAGLVLGVLSLKSRSILPGGAWIWPRSGTRACFFSGMKDASGWKSAHGALSGPSNLKT